MIDITARRILMGALPGMALVSASEGVHGGISGF